MLFYFSEFGASPPLNIGKEKHSQKINHLKHWLTFWLSKEGELEANNECNEVSC